MRRAYVTMLCNGDGYLPGAIVLGQSLLASGSPVDRIVLVTAEVSAQARQQLAEHGWHIRPVEPVAHPGPEKVLLPRFANVYTKLRAWEAVDYDRVVFLDSDTLVIRNVDELFEHDPFAAAPDFFLPDRFNSGVMVLEPSRDTLTRMMERLSTAATYDGGDQGFLNVFFEDWYAMPVEHRLPAGYNMPNFIYQFARGRPVLRSTLDAEARIVHYMLQKPWQARATLTGGSGPWWAMYFQAFPEKAREWKHGVHAMEDRTFDYLSSLVVR